MKFSIKTLLYVKKIFFFWDRKISGISKTCENQLTKVSKIIGITENSEKPVNQN